MKNRKVIIWILIGSFMISAIWGLIQYYQKEQYQTFLENQYQNDFYTLLNSVEGIEALLSKSMVVQSNEKLASIFSETWKNADRAQDSLNRLPISHQALNETSKFLSQLGDFSHSCGEQIMKGENLTDKQWVDLEKLHNNCVDLMNSLQKMHQEIMKNPIQFVHINREKNRLFTRASDQMTSIENNFIDMGKATANGPKLIYDGPFSEHLFSMQPKGLKGKDITREEGKQKAIDFLGEDRIEKITSLGSGEGTITTYSYEAVPTNEKGDRRVFIEVSKKGGHILWMMDSKVVREINYTMSNALEKAQEFLKEKGFENMVPSYAEQYNGVGIFNFAYQQNGVLIYPDLIKVQVALDNREIVGFEAQGFYVSHEERQIPKPKISLEEARNKVNDRLNIFKERMAIIPTSYQEEILCYEFKGTFQEDTFIVYINAETGKEQEILKVIRTDSGNLTI
ncbi:germination protein YpeB [Garciella nitratireducens]|uniref:Germination protein YpeB n=1 Tax=Garciella nitratireducens DSM 15102 TaxID=1121911 RepID=A0A1T4MGF1_9FIRM|nr:germination protein YpeB [Garciella nitratireducens]SJZ66022.1 germination protein YpeB [Garciella nitratireducens DSM 15102]